MQTVEIMTKLCTAYFIFLVVLDILVINVASGAACRSPCKMFHSWCSNGGKCKDKDEACTWYCECPENCKGFFCEKIVAKNELDNITNVKVIHDSQKKKDVSVFDKSKIAQALAGLLSRKENMTCSQDRLLEKTDDNKSDMSSTPSFVSDMVTEIVQLSISTQNNTTINSSTEENMTKLMDQSLHGTYTIRSLFTSKQINTAINGSTEENLNTNPNDQALDRTYSIAPFFKTLKEKNNELEKVTPIVKSTFAADVAMAARTITPLNVTLQSRVDLSSTDLPLTHIVHRNTSVGIFADNVSTAIPVIVTSNEIINHFNNTLHTVKSESSNSNSTVLSTPVEQTIVNLPNSIRSLFDTASNAITEQTVITASESKKGVGTTVNFIEAKAFSKPQTTFNQTTVVPVLQITLNISMPKEELNNTTEEPTDLKLQQLTTESSIVITSHQNVFLTAPINHQVNLPTSIRSLLDTASYAATKKTVMTTPESTTGILNLSNIIEAKAFSMPQTTFNQATVAPILKITANMSMSKEQLMNNKSEEPTDLNLKQLITDSSFVITTHQNMSLTVPIDIFSSSSKTMSDQMMHKSIKQNTVAGVAENIADSIPLSAAVLMSYSSLVKASTTEEYNFSTIISNVSTVPVLPNSAAPENQYGPNITAYNETSNNGSINIFRDEVIQVMLHNAEATRLDVKESVTDALPKYLNEDDSATDATLIIVSAPPKYTNGLNRDQTASVVSTFREGNGKSFETSSIDATASATISLNTSAMDAKSFTLGTSTSTIPASLSVDQGSSTRSDRNTSSPSTLTQGSAMFTTTMDRNEKSTVINLSSETPTLSQYPYASSDLQLLHTSAPTFIAARGTKSRFVLPNALSTHSINVRHPTETASKHMVTATDENNVIDSTLTHHDSVITNADLPISNSTQQPLTTNLRIDLSIVPNEFTHSNATKASAQTEDVTQLSSSMPAAEMSMQIASQIMSNQMDHSSSAVNLPNSESRPVNIYFGPDVPIKKKLTNLWNKESTKENSEFVEYINLERNKDKIEQTSDFNIL